MNIITSLKNIILLSFVFLIALSVATLALTKKVNIYKKTGQHAIKVTVIKDVKPLVAYTRGIVKKINVKSGDVVKKGSVIITLDNPTLKGRVDVLEKYTGNLSAQTEVDVIKEDLKNLEIVSPVDGVVGDILVDENSPVETLTKVVTIYSNDKTRLLSELTLEQFQKITKMSKVKAYNPRLNQNFIIRPELIQPDSKNNSNRADKKIGLYFVLVNKSDALSMLHNEDLEIVFDDEESTIKKPIDFFITFWNTLISNEKE